MPGTTDCERLHSPCIALAGRMGAIAIPAAVLSAWDDLVSSVKTALASAPLKRTSRPTRKVDFRRGVRRWTFRGVRHGSISWRSLSMHHLSFPAASALRSGRNIGDSKIGDWIAKDRTRLSERTAETLPEPALRWGLFWWLYSPEMLRVIAITQSGLLQEL